MAEKKSGGFFTQIEEYLIAIGIIVMVLMEALNALTRRLTFIPETIGKIPEEIAIFAYIWVCFLCASFCIKKGSNIIVDALSAKYPANMQNLLKKGQYIVDMITYAALCYGGVVLMSAVKAGDADTMKIKQVGALAKRLKEIIPENIFWFVYLAPIVCFALCILRNMQLLIKMQKEEKATTA